MREHLPLADSFFNFNIVYLLLKNYNALNKKNKEKQHEKTKNTLKLKFFFFLLQGYLSKFIVRDHNILNKTINK
jgi:hypothetical protein